MLTAEYPRDQFAESLAMSRGAADYPIGFKILETYGADIGKRDEVVRAGVHAAGLTHDFGGEKVITSELREAALLTPIAAGLAEEATTRNALQALGAYSRTHLKPTWNYATDLLTDIPYVEAFASSGRFDGSYAGRPLENYLNTQESLPIPANLWAEPAILASTGGMVKLLKTTNIESTLLASAIKLGELSAPADDIVHLQQGTDTRAFFAPICDIIGFDALSILLRNIPTQTTLMKQGNASYIEKAKSVQKDVSDRDSIAELNTTFLRDILGQTVCDISFPIRDTTNHGVIFGDINLGDNVRGVFREKGLGQIALKWLVKGGMPMDVNGITLIVENDDAVAKLYAQIIKTLPNFAYVEPKKAIEKSSPFFIEGHSAFVGRVLRECERVSYAPPGGFQVDPTGRTDKYHVAKFTARVSGVPTEVQILTQEMREAARIGKQSHMAYSAQKEGTPTERVKIEDLCEIHGRRLLLSEGETVPDSKVRGAELRDRVAQLI